MSKLVICVLAIVGGGVLSGVARAATTPLYDFSRYKVIVDRQPFGEPPQEAVAPAPPAQPPPPPFTKSLRLCGLSKDGGEIYVSFVDVGANPNESYYLRVGGEEKNGISAIRADIVSGEVILKKGSEELPININDSAAPGGARPAMPVRTAAMVPVPPVAVPPVPASPVMPARINPPATHGATGAQPTTGGSSWAERLRMQREQRLRALAAGSTPPAPPAPVAPPAPASTAVSSTETNVNQEERIRKLREYNMELIRAKGSKGPPLPIELSPDEDAQLVKEGVLPPQQ